LMDINENTIKLRLVGEKDNIFDTGRYPKPFIFNKEVSDVFDDMVTRSIPLYAAVNEYVVQWVVRYHRKDMRIYDIGCSTGTTMDIIARNLDERATFIGVDNSQAMIEKASSKLETSNRLHRFELICNDVLKVEIKDASIVILNYTLQFLPVSERLGLLRRIFRGLGKGGLFFISEKIRFERSEILETTTAIYERFKLNQGYSLTEIARKKEALENVLVPYTEAELRGVIESAGFKYCESVIKWNNFVSFVAIRGGENGIPG
ncbi:MAG: carboxy-S-adenosyl-L-methionine synthase CmoA, partial [Oligoflexales bacterium]|nr:carboxy-S-adenosyl-L-methionine synthase CmoA [Oligoflexales bacterium]